MILTSRSQHFIAFFRMLPGLAKFCKRPLRKEVRRLADNSWILSKGTFLQARSLLWTRQVKTIASFFVTMTGHPKGSVHGRRWTSYMEIGLVLLQPFTLRDIWQHILSLDQLILQNSSTSLWKMLYVFIISMYIMC